MSLNLFQWLEVHNIDFQKEDDEVVFIPGFGKIFIEDLSDAKSILKKKGDGIDFNLMEQRNILLNENIEYVAYPFGDNWYYFDLREGFNSDSHLNILKYVGHPQRTCGVQMVNLGVHSPFELLNASGSLNQLCDKVEWMGQRAVGICNYNTLAGALAFQKECTKRGVNPIFGYSSAFKFEEAKVNFKVFVLDQNGLVNLLKIHRAVVENDGFVPYKLLKEYLDGLVFVFGVNSSEWMSTHKEQVEEISVLYETYYQFDASMFKAERIDKKRLEDLQCFIDNFHVGDMRFSIRPILISDSYYLDQDDAKDKIILNKIDMGASHEQSDCQYLKSSEEHRQVLEPLFKEPFDFMRFFKLLCRPTIWIAERASARFETGHMYMPEYDMRQEEKELYGNRRKMFRELLNNALETLVPIDERARYQKRLNEELYIIESTNNVDYFLVQWDVVREAHRRGIATGIGRGSAGGSLVSYLLGITSIDPLEYDLIFSRFLVPERCGLLWKDRVSCLQKSGLCVSDGEVALLDTDEGEFYFSINSKFWIKRNGVEMEVCILDLKPNDELIFDRVDSLWNLKELSYGESRTSNRKARNF